MTTLTSLDDLKYVVSLSFIHGSKTFPMHRPIRKSLENKVLDLEKVVTIFFKDSCDCRQITLESNLPCLELVFLIDGSDSFNSKFNDNGNGLFQLAVAWTNRFLKSCKFKLNLVVTGSCKTAGL